MIMVITSLILTQLPYTPKQQCWQTLRANLAIASRFLGLGTSVRDLRVPVPVAVLVATSIRPKDAFRLSAHP